MWHKDKIRKRGGERRSLAYSDEYGSLILCNVLNAFIQNVKPEKLVLRGK